VLRVLDAGDAEEVEENCSQDHEDGAEKAANEEGAEKSHVAEVRDAARVGLGDGFRSSGGRGRFRWRNSKGAVGERRRG